MTDDDVRTLATLETAIETVECRLEDDVSRPLLNAVSDLEEQIEQSQ